MKTYKNVDWVGGVTREEVQKLIQQSDIGIGWRNNSLNDSLELSTKALEYGALGKPVILNRTPMHERLFDLSIHSMQIVKKNLFLVLPSL